MNDLVQSGKRFGVIIADPPWNYRSKIKGHGDIVNHYDTMTPKDLEALPVARLAADDAVLLMWTTWPVLDQALDLVKAWGFRYKAGMPWIKLQHEPFVDISGDHVEGAPAWGTGFWIRGCSEPILICTKGKAKAPCPGDRPMGLISKRFEHSRKPDNLHEYAELFPGPYLELFARRPRQGWTTWGDQAPNDDHDQTDAPALSAASTATGQATASGGGGYGA